MVNFEPLELSEQDKEYLKMQARAFDDIIKSITPPEDYVKFPVIPYKSSRKVVNPLNVYGSPAHDD